VEGRTNDESCQIREVTKQEGLCANPFLPGERTRTSLFARLCYVVRSAPTAVSGFSSSVFVFAMLVVHPASLCDVCLDPYIISEPANSPHAIACGHIFCLTCLRNLSPSACPLCRKAFQPDRVKKLHVAGPPELDGAAEEMIEAEAAQLLQRVVLASSEDVPDVEIIEVVTKVEEWFSNNSADDNSHRPLRAALAALQRHKALQESNERDHAEYRRVRRELKAYRRNAHQDSKTSRAVEESLLGRIDEIENNHAL
jgi:hypothetical protein